MSQWCSLDGRPFELWSEWFRAALVKAKITPAELLERMRRARRVTHTNVVYRWTSGTGRPTHEKLECILDVLGIPEHERDKPRRLAYFPVELLVRGGGEA